MPGPPGGARKPSKMYKPDSVWTWAFILITFIQAAIVLAFEGWVNLSISAIQCAISGVQSILIWNQICLRYLRGVLNGSIGSGLCHEQPSLHKNYSHFSDIVHLWLAVPTGFSVGCTAHEEHDSSHRTLLL